MKLDVPYISQLTDIPDPYWVNRACGGVSLAMVLAYFEKPIKDLGTFMNEAKEHGGFTQEKGWHYRYLSDVSEKNGLAAKFKEPADEHDLVQTLKKGTPVIISVVKRLFGKERAHIVLLTGYEMEKEVLKGFYYHDPEALYPDAGAHQFAPISAFISDWKHRALFIEKKV